MNYPYDEGEGGIDLTQCQKKGGKKNYKKMKDIQAMTVAYLRTMILLNETLKPVPSQRYVVTSLFQF